MGRVLAGLTARTHFDGEALLQIDGNSSKLLDSSLTDLLVIL